MAGVLDGKVAVITGAGSGMGKATAELFRAEGAKLVVTGRRASKLNSYADGDDIRKIAGEITDPAFPDQLLQTALDAYGRCDIIYNNAGIMTAGTIEDIDIDLVCQMVRVNIEAAYRVAYVFVRHFKQAGSGHLISTSSVLGFKTRPTTGAYAGTKFAIEALTEALRLECAGTGVKIGAVEPGLVMTDLHDDFAVHPKETLGMDHPLLPEDVARSVLFMVTQPDHVLVPRVLLVPQESQV